jgi:hypothetical protein
MMSKRNVSALLCVGLHVATFFVLASCGSENGDEGARRSRPQGQNDTLCSSDFINDYEQVRLRLNSIATSAKQGGYLLGKNELQTTDNLCDQLLSRWKSVRCLASVSAPDQLSSRTEMVSVENLRSACQAVKDVLQKWRD